MNESDIEIGRVLLQFDQVIEEHNSYLEELENIIELPSVETDKIHRILKRMRRTRKEILSGISNIVKHIATSNDKKIKEEALGIMNYFYVVGIKDEENALRKVMEIDLSFKEDVEKDIETLEKIRSLVMQFIY
ncbi:hypothetical protein [Sulfurisphaera tokodaii]|uniref:Uncharacterized protein n=2 Tax=Sulfurisphaera tokodaii TaxID=111955 RepID=Q975R5_SULTO|nr:hypothetical protein [Sulfurisphaera tokodaii]BAB65335.1 hypothetical protein STK_03560 [Sulfurisphaera tokodaii str. 7]HII74967.1 hypothetical protein [Sulfurisphaera tokodaii]